MSVLALGRREHSQGKEASQVSQLHEEPGRTHAVNSEMQIQRRPGFLRAGACRTTCEFNFLGFSACARNQKALTVSKTSARFRKFFACGYVSWFRIISLSQYLYPNAFPSHLCACLGLVFLHLLWFGTVMYVLS